jgi:hypothetical protein
MIDRGDLEQMQADLQAVRDNRPVSITIRRATATLAAQTVRVGRVGAGSGLNSGNTREARGSIIVLGDPDLDIQVDDRFNTGGRLYRVSYVRLNRDSHTLAEGELIE